MKKLVLLLILLSSNAFSQSKGDTENWITSTIQNFARRDVYNRLLNVYFDKGDIWFVELERGGSYQSELPLNKIDQVIIKSDANGYVLVLGCKYNQTCCRIVH